MCNVFKNHPIIVNVFVLRNLNVYGILSVWVSALSPVIKLKMGNWLFRLAVLSQNINKFINNIEPFEIT